MSTTVDQFFEAPRGKFLADPYEDWARGEGVPIHLGASLDLLSIETKPWARMGVDGAICHLDGRDDFLTIFTFDLAPGAATTPARHLYEQVYYCLSGHGVMEIDLPGGGRTSVEWGPKKLFSAPMNTRVTLRNTSGARARVAGVNDMRYLLQLYRSDAFLNANPLDFPERANGDYIRDCAGVPLVEAKRPNEFVLPIVLASGSIGADLVEIPVGKYGRAARQMFGSLLLGVAGEGMTLSWEEGSAERIATKWRHGVVYAPAGMRFHQHCNCGAAPLRFLRVEMGSVVAPMFRPRRRNYGDESVYAAGVAEIDRDAAAERAWREGLAGG